MFRLNLKIGIRNLLKNKTFALINVGGLAIGLASCIVILLYVAYEWGYDKQISNYQNTYIVYTNQQSDIGKTSYGWTPAVMAPYLKTKLSGVKYASHSSYPEPHLIGNEAQSFRTNSVFADPDFLKILDYQILKGNPEQVLKQPNTVILTESLAKKLFGNEDPMNKTVKLDNEDLLKVEAVIADPPRNTTIQFDYLLPWSLFETKNTWVKDAGWQATICLTMVQLHDQARFSTINPQIRNIYKNNDKTAEAEAMIHPLSKWHLYTEFSDGKATGGKITQVRNFFLLAICVLIIACINFMNLSTARSEKRAKEVGVRKVIGSTRSTLISQFMIESYLLTIIGLIFAFALIELSLPYFNRILDVDLHLNYKDWKLWAGLTGLVLLTGFSAGSYPALYLSSFDPVKALKGSKTKTPSTFSIRKVLVVSQFVFAVCLIICTIMIYRQILFVKNKSIGYDKNNLIEIGLTGALREPGKVQLLKEQLVKNGLAKEVTNFSRSMTRMGQRTTEFKWPGKEEGNILFNFRFAGYNFTNTAGAQMAAGRDFSAEFSDSTSVLVNEAAVRTMQLKKPVGSNIQWGDRSYTIIGVVKDFVIESPFEKALPIVILHNDNNPAVLLVRLDPARNLSQAISGIDQLVKKLNPAFPVERKFIDEDFENKFKNEKLLGTVVNWFGGLAIFISCLGILGLSLYLAEQRKKEISIRKVLGASTYSILSLLNKDFIKLVCIANLIAFPIAYILINNWLSRYDFRTQLSPLPYIIAIALSLAIAILAVSTQSLKVVKAKPVDALRHE